MGDRIVNRNWVVLGAILIQLCLGAIYAWSVFTTPLIAEGWSKTQTQIVFSVGLASFAVSMVLAGRLMGKLGPRKLTMFGGVLLGAGYLAAGLFAGTDFWPLALLVGFVGGVGIGMAYVAPIAVGMRWFPDKKGLISGVAVAGFGFGALLWIKLAGAWGNLIANYGLSATFSIYGVVFALMVLVGAIWMNFPPEGWKPKGFEAQAASGKKSVAVADFTAGQMLRTPQFWMILLTFAFAASAGLMAIGLMKIYPMEALQAQGMETTAASAVAGTAMAVFYAIANGLGRIVWGWLCDRIGVKLAGVIMNVVQGVTVIAFIYMAGHEYLLYLGAFLIGFNYGGAFSLFPTITANTFGAKNVGGNYPFVFLAYGVGGIFGPILGGRLGDIGNFPLAFIICGVLCLIGAGIISLVKPPALRTS